MQRNLLEGCVLNIQEVSDRLEIMEVLSNYAAGLDARDWVLWRSVFVDDLEFDLTSWHGGTPNVLNADGVVRNQARSFAELAETQHFFTNHRITLDGDSARVIAHMRAEHWLDGASEPGLAGQTETTMRYTMFGYYDHDLVRTDEGWKISRMQLNVTRTEGNRWVMDESRRRARAKREQATHRSSILPTISNRN